MDRINKEKKSVSKKLQETAKETERLKRELETLIASGIQGPEKPIFLLAKVEEKPSEKPTFRPPLLHKSEKGKHQEQKKDITEAELRKKKLKELHQKATEIVKKNAKRRERSKQRQPQGTIRSKSCSSITKSCESVIISCNSAISIKRGLKQYLQVPQSEITPPINLKKSKSTHNISSIHSESRSHPLNLNIDGIGEQESPRDITIEVKRNQGAIPKRPRLSDLQLPRNVTLRSNHSVILTLNLVYLILMFYSAGRRLHFRFSP